MSRSHIVLEHSLEGGGGGGGGGGGSDSLKKELLMKTIIFWKWDFPRIDSWLVNHLEIYSWQETPGTKDGRGST